SSVNSEKFICKESFWWDGLEIIPPRPKLGLLSTFANRGANCDEESIISDESTTEENTEEETISSSSLESDEGSAESNPPPKQTLVKKPKKNSAGKLLWQHNLSARSNQDIQRAYEESLLKDIGAILSRKTLNDTTNKPGTRTVGRNSIPLGGLWMRLESEWRESLNQRETQPKAKNFATSKTNKPRSRF
ncbi:hypothetical protein D910_09884, partial [Dendroctonus ponderosae]